MPSIITLQAQEYGYLIHVSELAIKPLSLATRLRRAFLVGGAIFGIMFAWSIVSNADHYGTGTAGRTAFATTLTCSFGTALTGALGAVLFRRRPLRIPETLQALYSHLDFIPLPRRTILVDQAERRMLTQDVSGAAPRSIPFEQIQAIRLVRGSRPLWKRYRVEPVVSKFGEVVFTVARNEAEVMTSRVLVLELNDGREVLLADGVALWQPSNIRLVRMLDECLAR